MKSCSQKKISLAKFAHTNGLQMTVGLSIFILFITRAILNVAVYANPFKEDAHHLATLLLTNILITVEALDSTSTRHSSCDRHPVRAAIRR